MTGNTGTGCRRIWHTDMTVVDDPRDPGDACTYELDSGTDDEAMNPTVYVFTNNGGPNIRNSGSRETAGNLRLSFDPDLQWLDDAAQDEKHMSSEVKDSLCLYLYKE